MNARDFPEIADRFKDSAKKSECRTSIGRSYYGLLNVLLGALAVKGVPFRQPHDDHHLLVAYLTKASIHRHLKSDPN